jgi:hypothetical protein
MRITKTTVIIAIIAVVGVYCLSVTIRNLFLSEEEKVKRVFYAIANAAEKKSVTGVTKYLSADFKIEYDFYGHENISYPFVSRFLIALYRQFDEPKVKIESIFVEVKEDAASASLAGYFSHKADPSRLYYECSATLKKKDGEWLVTSAKAKRQAIIRNHR